MRTLTLPINGSHLRSLRLRKNLKQVQVENALQLPKGRITQFERGEVDVTLEHVELLASYFGVDGRTILSQRGYDELLEVNRLVSNLLKEI